MMMMMLTLEKCKKMLDVLRECTTLAREHVLVYSAHFVHGNYVNDDETGNYDYDNEENKHVCTCACMSRTLCP